MLVTTFPTSRKPLCGTKENPRRVWSVLDDVVKEHPVMLNRAPTLHRLGIQAFEPVLVQGKAIKLHPLVCHAYNADFDGDQMAIHVPLTQAAQIECWTLMLSVNNLLNPANGSPVVFPSQDMVLGINYLTKIREGEPGEGKFFTNMDEVILAREYGVITYNTRIRMKMDGEIIETSAGRLFFNEVMPDEVKFVNKVMGEKELRSLVAETYSKHGPGCCSKDA